ncbi:Uncharacterised protein [[Clostridium] sordellii]|uniref:hypothetical protein n=1 Tax=Paraclostridium sordellii TaxID=1505 RepID=UPI0005DC11D1|nr:hypothetical protein [Paeniclostridium sordellii]CEN76191.1 Uncharacterised protein [[Clostridium] sordellii] [Paeniclostridium sordellii]
MKKTKKYSIIFFILNLLLTATIVLSEYIYSSYYNVFSWYENCGTQFLIILIISIPIFILLSVLYYLLGRKNIISGLSKNLPLISLGVFLIPIIIDTSLSPAVVSVGTFLGFCVLITSVFTLLKSFKNIFL